MPAFDFAQDRLALTGADDFYQQDGIVTAVFGKIFKVNSPKVPTGLFDAQIVAHLYRNCGDDFVKLIDGHHLILLYDIIRDFIVIANNKYQASNGYIWESNDILHISNSLESFVKHNDSCPPTTDWKAVSGYLSNGFFMTERTILDGVKKLLPSVIVTVDKGTVTWCNHAAISFNRVAFSNVDSQIDRYEGLYRAGIETFLEKERPQELGCLLSGDHDSSFAFIQGTKVFNKPIHAYTVSFKGWKFDEESYAREISNKFGGIFHPVPFGPQDLDWTVGMVRAVEEPVVSSSLPIYVLAKKAEVPAMLGGDGGDTLWGEYYPVVEFHRFIRHLPLTGRKLIHKLAKQLKTATDWERAWELEHVANLFAQADPYEDFLSRLMTYRHFPSEALEQLLVRDLLTYSPVHASAPAPAPVPASAPSPCLLPIRPKSFADDLIAAKLINGFFPYMSFYTTKILAHFGTELFLPAVMDQVQEFVGSLPQEWLNGGTFIHRLSNSKSKNRRLHKLALARYLEPKAIRNKSFDVPWHLILLPRPNVLELLEARLKRRGWYNDQVITNMFSEFRHQSVNNREPLELKHHGYRIFTLLTLEIWATEYLDCRWTPNPDRPIPLEDYLAH